MHSQPPKSPLSGGLWKLREGRSYCRCLLISLIHHKLLSTDFFTGQILFSGKGLLDILWFLIRNPQAKSLRLAGLILQLIPRYTKVSVKRLINLHRLAQKVNRLNLPGDIVECGVWNGGSAAIMGMGVADRDGETPGKVRTLWLFDSFCGLPPPSNKDGKQARETYFQGWCHGETEKVKRIFRRFQLSLQHVNIIAGWFDETLQTADLQTIALLHIDADWYASVKIVLDNFYDKAVEGGFVVLDDYWRRTRMSRGCNRLSQRTSDSRGSIETSGSTRRLFSKTTPMRRRNSRLTIKDTSFSNTVRNNVIFVERIDGQWKVINFVEYAE